ncbi:MAG: membrane protein insertase YidC [Waddliaceae bacterium]|nr:membrane protein insertase YidC [Waddliaceae bacterium]
MDKRTLLFVVSLSLTLFVVQLFFNYQNVTSDMEWRQQQIARAAMMQERLEQDVAKRTETETSLPIQEVFADASGIEFLSYGVENNGVTLFLSDRNLDGEVYVRKQGEGSLKRRKILAHEDSQHVFLASASDQKVSVSYARSRGNYDIQVVSSQNTEDQHLVFLAETKDGHFSFPLNVPSFPSIALSREGDHFLPLGIYQPNTGELKLLNQLEDLSSYTIALTAPKQATAADTEEKYYVLENEYQQLVFSNIGAALVEINLPLESEENSYSVVRPIEIDRDILEDYPHNALFPKYAYYKADARGEVVKHEKGKEGGYYPLLRRDILSPDGLIASRVKPEHYALNILSKYPEMAELPFQMSFMDKEKIVFEARQPHRRITKTYTLQQENHDSPYIIDFEVQVEGDSQGLWLSSGLLDAEWMSGSSMPAQKLRNLRQGKTEIESISLPKSSTVVNNSAPDWVCNSNGFFGVILDPLTEIGRGYRTDKVDGELVPSRLVEVGAPLGRYPASSLPAYKLLLPLNQSGSVMKFRVFAGPLAADVLHTLDKTYTNSATGESTDYIESQTVKGWFSFISAPFSKLLFWVMSACYFLTQSWAFSIILLTVALKLMLWPLSSWSIRSMRRMQEITPLVQAIQEKHKNDSQKAQVEIMNLYRDKGVNPLGGCFPILIQMPFLIGMFDLLKSSFELRGQPFITGWIDNLTAPDVLFSWGQSFWIIGNEFHLLPILLGLTMFFQQRFSSTAPKDPNLMTEQQRQQKAMGTMMTVVFTVMFYNFPSGLNLYWISSMLLGWGQQWLTNRNYQPTKTDTPQPPAPKKKGGNRGKKPRSNKLSIAQS